MASQSHQVSAVDDIVSEYQGIEAQMSDPETVGDQALFRKLSKRYSELQPIMKVNTALEQARADLADAKEMAYEDSEFAPEADRLAGEVVELEEKLADLLAPRDPHDGDDIVMEIKARAGKKQPSSPVNSYACTNATPTNTDSAPKCLVCPNPTWAESKT